ncbi:MAG: acyl-CoA dehydrogenase [Myxococcaceae bacterium]|nr:acyl-CoA dehydrogenase [Myxococcaceae bacterium]
MSHAPHYKHNLRDIEFNLFEALDIAKTSLGKKPFGDLDEATARQTLATMATVASEQLGPSFSDAGLSLEFDPKTGTVKLPPAMKKAFDAYFDNGLNLLDLPAHLGGLGAPPTFAWGAFELVVGSAPSLAFYFLGNVLSRIIDALATDAQKKRFVKPMLERRWGGTMVLTEPDAGSDVGAARAKAKHVEGDVWEIEGVKRFITNGDFDAVENILHLVLARPEGAKPGTKGLSMFIVPKFHVNEDGSLGERNGVYCTNVEKKLGLSLSATCEMTFGDKHPARGYLVGEVHDGIRQMFHVIEHARMAIGQKSAATLSTAYLNALAYAKERKQGSDLKEASNKAAPKVTVIKHPDVRRMLMLQKSFAEGMRALVLFGASLQDEVALKGGHTAEAAAEANAMNDLLLPLIKGYNSEKVYELLAMSLQTFGGSGYLKDYPIEQYIRDQKIDSLYEGTTHIQALDLIFRKVARDGGATLQALLGRVKATLEAAEGGDSLKTERAALSKAVGELEAAWGALLEKLGESLYHVGLQGNRLLFATAEVVIGWLLVRHAAIAEGKRAKATGPDASFYEGKVASARFYAHEVLPQVALAAQAVQNSSLMLMELPDEAF